MNARGPWRILAIAPTSFFADYGCHVRIRGQLAALRARGHEVLLVTYPSGQDVPELQTWRAPWPGTGPIQVGSSRLKIVLDSILAPTALAAARRFRPHVIHAYLHEGALIGWAVAGLLRLPLIFDFQGSLASEMQDHRFLSSRSPWLKPLGALERWIDQRPNAILASSANASRLLSTGFGVPDSRVVTLADSVDATHFRPADGFDAVDLENLRASYRLPAGRRLIVYLGLLAPYQGTDLLLSALAHVLPVCPNAHLLLMGFPFVDHYRALARQLGIGEHVTLTGGVPYEVAPAHLALGELAVAPKLSATEGSGKVLTYMASSLPVVATDTPVHREYLGEAGIYAPPGDARALASGILLALGDREGSRERGALLRKRAAAAYTWESAAAAIEQIYRLVSG